MLTKDGNALGRRCFGLLIHMPVCAVSCQAIFFYLAQALIKDNHQSRRLSIYMMKLLDILDNFHFKILSLMAFSYRLLQSLKHF